VQSSIIPYGGVFGEFQGPATIDEFIRFMDTLNTSATTGAASSHDAAQIYVFDFEFLNQSLPGQYGLPPCIASPAWVAETQVHQFFLGPAGSGAPFHYHCSAVNTLVYGRKRWWLYPPAATFYSKRHPAQHHATASEYSGGPVGGQPPLQCTQEAGDTLFVPPFWVHSTLNLAASVGFALEQNHGDC
jgi:hypothetical protein